MEQGICQHVKLTNDQAMQIPLINQKANKEKMKQKRDRKYLHVFRREGYREDKYMKVFTSNQEKED